MVMKVKYNLTDRQTDRQINKQSTLYSVLYCYAHLGILIDKKVRQ